MKWKIESGAYWLLVWQWEIVLIIRLCDEYSWYTFVNAFLKNMQAADLSKFIESLTKAIYINNIEYN